MLSPSASYAAGQRWFTPDQAAREHARALQHPETDFDPETGAVELHSALSSLNEATFETAQVRLLAGSARHGRLPKGPDTGSACMTQQGLEHTMCSVGWPKILYITSHYLDGLGQESDVCI